MIFCKVYRQTLFIGFALCIECIFLVKYALSEIALIEFKSKKEERILDLFDGFLLLHDLDQGQ